MCITRKSVSLYEVVISDRIIGKQSNGWVSQCHFVRALCLALSQK